MTYKLRRCVWEITLACCFKCKYCGSRAGHARENELTTEECLKVADELVMYDETGAIINRATRPELAPAEIAGAPVLAVIGPDDNQIQNDISGDSVFALPADSPLLAGVKEAMEKMKI